MMAGTSAVLESTSGESAVLQDVRVQAQINDLLAEVTMVQKYRNPRDTNIEAVYTFPLPFDAVLLDFEIEIGGHKLAGKVVEKSEAERDYEDAIVGGDTAVLLEQCQPGLYTASVGNILPDEVATIRFRYGVQLRWNGDTVRFMMPTAIAPRYGDADAAGLRQHQIPEVAFDADQSFSLAVTVNGILAAAHFTCPTHNVTVAEAGDAMNIDVVGTPAMDRDFVLEAHAPAVEACGALCAPDQDGWVALASFRPEVPNTEFSEPRCVKIVVDCSGSMTGDAIAQARDAIDRVLDDLREGDFFEIICFGSGHSTLFGSGMPVSETSLGRARDFVRTIEANMGGTEIHAALTAAYAVPTEPGVACDLLLITDGEIWNSEDVILAARRSGHRIFTIGVGSAVAEPFVRELAEVTGGACELVSPREDMAERIHRHFQRMYAPRAKSATIIWPGSTLRTLPETIETVYGGDTLHALAWFGEEPTGPVDLSVTLADGCTISHRANIMPFEEASTAVVNAEGMPSTLARMAAARRLIAMTDTDAAKELAVRYQLMSQWTNYLVVHVRAEGEKSDDLPEIYKVPQMLAAGTHGMGSVVAHSSRLMDFDESLSAGNAILNDADHPSLGSANFATPSSPRRQSRSRGFSLFKRKVVGDPPTPPDSPSGPSVLDKDPRQVRDGVFKLVGLLNARTIQGLPTLDHFKMWRLPEDIALALRRIVESGHDEHLVMVAFLYLLAESVAGKNLERQVRRRILKAHATEAPDQAVMDAATGVLEEWQRKRAMAET
jgi:Ca-activated chloride channel homolog